MLNATPTISIMDSFTASVTTTDRPEVIYHAATWEERLWLIILIGICQFIGLLGNVLVLIVFGKRLRTKRSHDFHNYMIFALAVGDIVALVAFGTFHQVDESLGSEALCKVWSFACVFCSWYVHMMICLAIPVERLYAIFRPYEEFGSRKKALLFGFTTATCIPYAVAYSIYYTVYNAQGDVVGCHLSYRTVFGGIVVPTVTLASFGLTFIAVFIMYAALFVRVSKLRKCSPIQRKSTELSVKTRVAVMLFGVTIVYFGCYLPFFLLAFQIIPYDARYKALFLFGNATNFLVYAALNPKIRQEMIEVFRCKRRAKEVNYSIDSTTHTDT